MRNRLLGVIESRSINDCIDGLKILNIVLS